jgi:hypothetical protein
MGWNYEAGLVHSLKKSSFSLQHDITGYSIFTNDLIIWLPQPATTRKKVIGSPVTSTNQYPEDLKLWAMLNI